MGQKREQKCAREKRKHVCVCTEIETLNGFVHFQYRITLIQIKYWDRAGGGGNIGYDW